MIHIKISHEEIQVKGHAHFNLAETGHHATMHAVRGSGHHPPHCTWDDSNLPLPHSRGNLTKL